MQEDDLKKKLLKFIDDNLPKIKQLMDEAVEEQQQSAYMYYAGVRDTLLKLKQILTERK